MGVGISGLIGLKSTQLRFPVLSVPKTSFVLLSFPFLYTCLIDILVSIAPMFLGKNTDGSFPIWSLIIFSPYLYIVRFFSLLRRFRSEEAPYTEISAGLYVGGQPASPEKLPPGDPAIIDCTCEFLGRTELAYRCIPTWDIRAPQPTEIELAVK